MSKQIAEVRALHRQGDLAAAESGYARILSGNPDHFEALQGLGLLNLQRGSVEQASALLERAVGSRPDDLATLINSGNAYARLGRFDKAVSAYDRALAVEPRNARAWLNRGTALMDFGEGRAGVESFRRALESDAGSVEARIGLANACLDTGAFSEAARFLEALQSKFPQDAEILARLGLAWFRIGQILAADSARSQALAQTPNLPDTLFRRGVDFLALEQHGRAATCFRLALFLKPGWKAAAYNAAVSLVELHEFEEALASFELALSLSPGTPIIMLGRASCLHRLGRYEDAKADIARVLELQPDFAEAYPIQGEIFLEIGDLPKAIESYAKAISLGIRSGRVLQRLAMAKHFRSEFDDHLQLFREEAAHIETLPLRDQAGLHFALGKALEDLGHYEEALSHMLSGNLLRRSTFLYDEKTTLDEFNVLKSVFTRDLMRQKNGAGCPSNSPILVVGMPRSGSTLVEQIIASHPLVAAAGEVQDLDITIQQSIEAAGRHATFASLFSHITPEQLGEIGSRYVEKLRLRAPNAERITDKMLSNFFFVGALHLMLPNARIIHVQRNPIDTCLSCFSKNFSQPMPYAYSLPELGRYYRAYSDLMNYWRTVLPPGSFLDVTYEALVDDPSAQSRRLLTYCGLDWDDKVLRFYENKRPVKTASASQVRQPIYRSAVGRASHYGQLLNPLLDALGDLVTGA